MSALPTPPRKVTELLPLPAQPPQVKTPEVVNVTGSAFACDVPKATTARSRAPMIDALKMCAIFRSPSFPNLAIRTTGHRAIESLGLMAPSYRLMFPHPRATQMWKHMFDRDARNSSEREALSYLFRKRRR